MNWKTVDHTKIVNRYPLERIPHHSGNSSWNWKCAAHSDFRYRKELALTVKELEQDGLMNSLNWPSRIPFISSSYKEEKLLKMKEKIHNTEMIETKETGCSDKADGEQLCQEISENKLLCVCACVYIVTSCKSQKMTSLKWALSNFNSNFLLLIAQD